MSVRQRKINSPACPGGTSRSASSTTRASTPGSGGPQEPGRIGSPRPRPPPPPAGPGRAGRPPPPPPRRPGGVEAGGETRARAGKPRLEEVEAVAKARVGGQDREEPVGGAVAE